MLRGCWFWSKKLRFRKNFDANFNAVERVTPVAGSIFGPLSQTHFSKRDFKYGHISRSYFVPNPSNLVGKVYSAEEREIMLFIGKKLMGRSRMISNVTNS